MSPGHVPRAGSAAVAPGPVASSQLFRRPTLLWGADNLAAQARATTPWLWHGYLALGALTLLFGRCHAGKTMLASVLLARLKKSGEFAGLSLAAANAIVVSGEAADRWQCRSHTLDFGDHVGWFCQPFRGAPGPDKWLGLIDEIAQLRLSHNVRLVVIDPLAAFIDRLADDSAASLLEVLLPLKRLSAVGLAVLALHDRRKADPPLAEAVRGSGALADHIDIAIEMHKNPRATDDDRRRRLHAFSSYPETPGQRVIELTPDGADYTYQGSFYKEELARHWQALRTILDSAPHKLTRAEILDRWSADTVPDPTTVNRRLERAARDGLVHKDGLGTKRSPFRYWLPEQAARLGASS
jgi:hypothetical protein